jgi:hypothetical protein
MQGYEMHCAIHVFLHVPHLSFHFVSPPFCEVAILLSSTLQPLILFTFLHIVGLPSFLHLMQQPTTPP